MLPSCRIISTASLALLVAIIVIVQASQVVFLKDVKRASTALVGSPALPHERQIERPAITLSTSWASVGPFPSGMREHQMGTLAALALHPLATIFDLREPVRIPSAYGYAAYVSATELQSEVLLRPYDSTARSSGLRHKLHISYPNIDWSLIKLSVGWAGLQWEAMSVTDLTVHSSHAVTLSINIDKAASFAIISEEQYLHYDEQNSTYPIQWHNGDMYSYNQEPLANQEEAPTHLIELNPGRYKILLNSVYEIRIFGSGQHQGPQIEHIVDIHIVSYNENVTAITAGQYGIMPDIVDGNAAGWGLSFAIRNKKNRWLHVTDLEVLGAMSKYLSTDFSPDMIRLAPLQTRPIKARLTTLMPVPDIIDHLKIRLSYQFGGDLTPSTVMIKLALKHVRLVGRDPTQIFSYRYTFLDSDDTLQYAAVVPPRNLTSSSTELTPALVYLHGAGVDVRAKNAQEALLPQEHSWIIHPSGRSPWGLDWQTTICSPLSALKAFAGNMYGLADEVKKTARKIDTKRFMIAGHSNGGQGTLYFSTKYPDLILGAVIGAPYISLSNYVPFTWQQGRHYNDAALSGILKSSLDLFQNDLYISNLAGIPMLFKYGSKDDNVPTWHTKEMVSLLHFWNSQSHASDELTKVAEVANRSHYWDEFMREDDVQEEFERRLQRYDKDVSQTAPYLNKFTLHVFNPEDSGSKQRWRIMQTEVPGRVSKLEVVYQEDGKVHVRSSNALQVVFDWAQQHDRLMPSEIEIDGSHFDIAALHSPRPLNFHKAGREWKQIASLLPSRPIGPIIRFLSSSGPIKIVLPTQCADDVTQQYLSIARRFALDTYIYNRIDCEILYDFEMSNRKLQDSANLLLLGGPTVNLISQMSSASQSVINFINGSTQFSIRDRHFAIDTTVLSLMPHPFHDNADFQKSHDLMQLPMALLLHGTDALSIEKGYNLLPIRTGTLLPEWIVVDRSSEWKGYGGVVGAGWFDHHWGWTESMSYLV